MIFDWLRRRRRQTLIQRPFSAAWRAMLEHHLAVYAELAPDEQLQVRNYVQVFVAEKHWEGCGGLTMTDEVRVTIAAQVAVLVLGLPGQYFDRVLSILVYPAAYVAPGKSVNNGIVTEHDSARLGEAWYRGPVIFSWSDVLNAARRTAPGNVVYHEFAHQLDMLNGQVVDGTPPLETADQDRRWLETNAAEYRRLVEDCRHGRHSVIDCYGATNRAEFFAVTTEAFFTRPHALKHRHPQLYAVLSEVYRQDPVARSAATA